VASVRLVDVYMPNTTTVLIVDEHILFREGLQSLLASEPDFRVIGQASGAREGVDRAINLKPDLVLMDINLPDGSGLEAAAAIVHGLSRTNVVILTFHEPEEYLLEAIRVGAKGFIRKDVPFAKLLAALRAVRNGETAISRHMVNRLADELRRIGRPTDVKLESLAILTARERQILGYLGRGASSRQIAKLLVISEHTVRVHIHNILAKLGLKTRGEAVSFARQHVESANTLHSRV
jgi:DNA-binding NarL/FixJ family response regulator